MAPPPSTAEEHALGSRRAKVRIGVAATLLITAIVILTVLNHRKPETPGLAQEPEAPATQASMSSAEMEAPQTPPAAAEPPAVAESSENTPPPPPVPGRLPDIPTKTGSVAGATALEEESAGASTAPYLSIGPAQTPARPGTEKRPTTSTPTPATIAQAKAFEVQLGVFTDLDNVKQFQARLAQHGIPSHTETRVQVGPFKTRTEADQAREKLKVLGISAVIVGK